MSANLTVQSLGSNDDLGAWERLIDESPQGSVFLRSAWLRATCGNSFSIRLVHDEGRIVGGMAIPYRVGRFGRRRIYTPPFTQTLGPVIAPHDPGTRLQRIYTREIEICRALIASLPDFDTFQQTCHYNFANWTPFRWAGFTQQTTYTYVFDDLSEPEGIVAKFSELRRRELKRAAKDIVVEEDLPIDAFYAFQKAARASEGMDLFYTSPDLLRLATLAKDHIKILAARNSAGNILASVLLAWDSHACYYLLPAVEPVSRQTGCVAAMIRHGIMWAARHSKRFDFEGSVTPGIEEYYRHYGASLKPLSQLKGDRRGWLTKAFDEGFLLAARSTIRTSGFLRRRRS